MFALKRQADQPIMGDGLLFENGEYTDAADIDESRIGDYGDDIEC